MFYSPQVAKRAEPYTYGALNLMLRWAETKAEVPHVRMNAAHRFRRGAAGNVLDLTGGDMQRAVAWIGDTDLKMAGLYLKERGHRLRDVADLLSLGAANRNQTATDRAQPLTFRALGAGAVPQLYGPDGDRTRLA